MSTNPSFDKDKFASAAANYASDAVGRKAQEYRDTVDKFKEMASTAGIEGVDGWFAGIQNGIQSFVTMIQNLFANVLKRISPNAQIETAANGSTTPATPAAPQNEAAARAAADKVRNSDVKLAEGNSPANAPASGKPQRQVGG